MNDKTLALLNEVTNSLADDIEDFSCGELRQALYRAIAQREEAATRIEALKDTLPPVGANGLYVCDGLGLSCTVIGHVEGWLEVKFHNDQSTCIVRPSRFNPQGSQP